MQRYLFNILILGLLLFLIIGCGARHQAIIPPSDLPDQPGAGIDATVVRYERPLVWKWNWLRWTGTHPKRWDLVVFRQKPEDTDLMALRVIALPGESITFNAQGILINDKPLEAPEPLENVIYPPGSFQVPENQYFLVSDDPKDTKDSRSFGAVDRKNIISRVVAIKASSE